MLPTMSTDHRAACLALVAPLRATWISSLTETYRRQARHNAAVSPAKARMVELKDFTLPEFVKVLVEGRCYAGDYYVRRFQAVRDGKVAPDYESADRRARVIANGGADFFAARLAEKLSIVFGDEAEPALSADITPRGFVVEGVVIAKLGEHEIRFDATGKANYRYGENSANRHFTAYGQYPMRVIFARIRGHGELHSTSAECVGSLVRGFDVVERAKAEKCAAKEKKNGDRALRWKLEAQKTAYNDIAWAMERIESFKPFPGCNENHNAERQDEIDKLCAKHDLVRPASRQEAKARAKELLVQIKALRRTTKQGASQPCP